MEIREVTLGVESGVATITLNRPDARNALSPGTLDGLSEALERCAAEEVRSVVVTGTGPAFCSGADVRGFIQALEVSPANLSEYLQSLADQVHRRVLLKIRELQKPVIACVNGVAAGAGVGLALACDLRIASEDARFFLAYANIGATPDGSASYYLPRLVGQGKAVELYLMNQPLGAQSALEMGLVNRVVPAAELEKHTGEWAQRLASGPTLAYGRMKALMDQSWTSDLAPHLDLESRTISEIALTGDFQEGVRAFVEKRAPAFKGE